MADDELEAIRARRMAELQQGMQGKGGGGYANQKAEAEKQAQMEEMKNNILSQVLDQQARARLNTLMVAKPEKAKMVENMLLNMAQMGQLAGKLGEEELIQVLERVKEQTQRNTTVKFDRRRAALDDSDED